jgi:hypothetical protein
LLKKAPSLLQNTQSKKCDFCRNIPISIQVVEMGRILTACQAKGGWPHHQSSNNLPVAGIYAAEKIAD